MAMVFRLFALIAIVSFAIPAQAAEKVRTRAWSDQIYGRIIFDWNAPVKYKARVDSDVLTVSFNRPMEADLNRILKYLGSYVENASLSADGKTATFELAGLFEMDSYASGKSVVIDLRRTQATRKASRGDSMAPIRVRVGRHPGFTRLVFDWLDPVGYTVSRDGRSARVRFENPGSIDVQRLDASLPKPEFGSSASGMDGAQLFLDLTLPENSFLRHFRTGAKIVVDIQQGAGDFGGMVVAESGGPVMQTISPTGEILAIPAMVGTTIAVAPDRVPLITEDIASVPANVAPTPKDPYDPLAHYNPNARGDPRDLLLYGRTWRPAAPEGS